MPALSVVFAVYLASAVFLVYLASVVFRVFKVHAAPGDSSGYIVLGAIIWVVPITPFHYNISIVPTIPVVYIVSILSRVPVCL